MKSTRPPGTSTRRSSASASSWSGTVQSTRVDTASSFRARLVPSLESLVRFWTGRPTVVACAEQAYVRSPEELGAAVHGRARIRGPGRSSGSRLSRCRARLACDARGIHRLPRRRARPRRPNRACARSAASCSRPTAPHRRQGASAVRTADVAGCGADLGPQPQGLGGFACQHRPPSRAPGGRDRGAAEPARSAPVPRASSLARAAPRPVRPPGHRPGNAARPGPAHRRADEPSLPRRTCRGRARNDRALPVCARW